MPASSVPAKEREEALAFLRWLADEHFTLLGYNAYALEESADGVQLRREKGAGTGNPARRTTTAALSPELSGPAGRAFAPGRGSHHRY